MGKIDFKHDIVTAANIFSATGEVHMFENTIFLGANDKAVIYVDTTYPQPGDTLVIRTDDFQIPNLRMEGLWIIVNAGGGTGGRYTLLASHTEFKWQPNQRAWLEAIWDGANREVSFGTDIAAEQKELPITFLNVHTGAHMLQIKGFGGTVSLHGDITLDPRDSGLWPDAKVVIGGPTDNVEINGFGDINFVAGGGLQLGEIFYLGDSFDVVTAAQDVWYKITGFNTNGESNGVVVPDHTQDHLALGNAGIYVVGYSVDVSSVQSNRYEFSVKYNGGLSTPDNSGSCRHTTVAGKIAPAGKPFLAAFPAGAELELYVKRLNGGAVAKTITIYSANLLAAQFGGN